ncbi:unnamed protein product [Pieris brassicae]|uniref:Secreted protein n=1 Tax=Pieris brassicae TaxID=7116 RepID=A0A9P0TI92_PIEBR|nr:unnamed protein product [Pieris brassicae]
MSLLPRYLLLFVVTSRDYLALVLLTAHHVLRTDLAGPSDWTEAPQLSSAPPRPIRKRSQVPGSQKHRRDRTACLHNQTSVSLTLSLTLSVRVVRNVIAPFSFSENYIVRR